MNTISIINEGRSVGPYLFIVNPYSGTGGYKLFTAIAARLKGHDLTFDETNSEEHMIALAQGAKSRGFNTVVAVGGDGTVHGIANVLINSETCLGIIPTGSGNGIARHLGVSMNIQKAIDQVLNGKIKTMDTLKVNSRNAIGFCGLGFDAYVAKLFEQAKGRGFWKYVRLTLKALLKFKNKTFKLDGETIEKFMIIAANISQFGNDAFINPESIDNDGQFELILMDRPSIFSLPSLASRLFKRSFHKSKFVTVTKTTSAIIENKDRAELQIDGEAVGCPERIEIEINPQSLNVIAAEDGK